ncbi:MAG: hypothetical protein ACPLPX_02110 [Candidatus Kapaibacteriota bacterium]
MKVIVFVLCFLFATACSLSQLEMQQLLELFYEETGKYRTVDEIEFYTNYKIELTMENAPKIADLLGVGKRTAFRIVSLGKKGISIAGICDSLNLLSSQCQLLQLCTRLPEVATKKENSDNQFFIDLKSRIYTNFWKDSTYLGDANDFYQRFKIKFREFNAGFSFSKDIGEISYLDDRKYFLSYDNPNHRVILGRFISKSFWGNVLGEPYGVYKGSNPVETSFSNETKIKPTTSSLDWGTFNGIALSTNWSITEGLNLNINGFISSIKRNGNYDTSSGIITSIYTMGYFRDSNEIKKRNVLKENAYFLQISTTTGSLTFGYSFFNLRYNRPIQTSSNKFVFGNGNLYHSFFYDLNFYDCLNFSSELSIDKVKNIGLVSGLKYIAKRFATTLNARYFSSNFRSPFGTILGENSYPNNEFGIFYSFEIDKEYVSLQFYSDLFKSLGPAHLLQVPLNGNDQFIQLLFKPFEKCFTRIRVRREEKTDYIYNVQKTYQIPYQRTKFEFFGENIIRFWKIFSSKQRFNFVFLNHKNYLPNETGLHLSLDLTCSILESTELGSRVNYFSTTSFSSAIYYFEVIAPEYMRSIPFYGTGWRFAFWSEIKLLKYINLYGKYYFQSNSKQKNFLLFQLDVNYFF